jgi:phospholipid/cholesterol/gamma-HCH transport system ATP-binding protein
MNKPLIQIRNLSKAFQGRTILDGVSFDIRRNEVTAIIGKSGVGKSVLVKHIIGLIEPDSGDILFDGQAYAAISRKTFSRIKDRCSYMFQHNALFDSLTVFENIILPLRERGLFDKAEAVRRVHARMEQLELTETAHLYPKEISGGMQKRVALARALVTEPEIIFFDEPTTGLDPIRKKAVFSMIHRYHRELNFTAVIITHDIPDIFYIAHAVHILDEGKIIFSGDPITLEQSMRPELYEYTHGSEMLLDDLTGFADKPSLARLVEQRAPLPVAAVHIHGLRRLMDIRGRLLGHTLIEKIAAFIRRDPELTAGLASQETIVIIPRRDDDTETMTRVAQFLESSEISRFCTENDLRPILRTHRIEAGGLENFQLDMMRMETSDTSTIGQDGYEA